MQKVTINEAIDLAVLHNPDFRSTGYDVTAAQGAVVQASVLPNPSIEVSSYGRPVKPLNGPVPTQFGLGFTVPIGGKISAATASAEAALDAAKATREAAHRQLIINVQTAFFTLQLNQLLLSFAQQDQTGFHKELDLNELRYKDGKIAFGDLLKLRIQAVSTDDEVREANEQVENARADLRHVVGEGILADAFEVVGELLVPKSPGLGALDELETRALEKRPDYLSLLASEKSAESALLARPPDADPRPRLPSRLQPPSDRRASFLRSSTHCSDPDLRSQPGKHHPGRGRAGEEQARRGEPAQPDPRRSLEGLARVASR